jgi:O-antigen ligase
VALLPLAVVPAAVDSFVAPKWAALAIGGGALFLLSVLAACQRQPLTLKLTPVNGLLAATLLWSTLSVLWAEAPALVWEEVRRLGLVLGVLVLVQSIVGERRDRFLRIAAWFRVSTCAIAAWALVADARHAFGGGTPVSAVLGDWRDAIGTASMGNSGHVGDILALGFLAWVGAFLLARRVMDRGIAIAALALHAAGLIVAWSVHSNLSLIVGSAVAVALLAKRPAVFALRRRIAAWGGLALAFALVIAFFVVDHPANPHGSAVWAEGTGQRGGIFAQAFSSARWREGGSTRLAIWLTTLQAIHDAPWLGHGAGNFQYVYPATVSELVLRDPDLAVWSGRWTNAAHNDILQRWCELGVPGLFLTIAAVAVAFWRAGTRIRRTTAGNATVLALCAGALAAQTVQMQMSFPLELPVSSLVFVLLLAAPDMLGPRGAEAEERLLMPINREIGPLKVRVALENMQIPRELGVTVTGPAWSIAAAAAIGAVVLAPGAWRGVQWIRADIAYRSAREPRLALQRMDPRSPQARALAAQFEANARRTLALWPAHVDCRSALSDHLVSEGRWSEALPEIERTAERLNSIEVLLRRARALQGLGRTQEAIPFIEEARRRRPDLAR